MHDNHGRNINYLRLSITDRCNLRCCYCMPATGIVQKTCGGILRYEQFLQIVAAAVDLGIRKVRVTGGEPLVRRGVIDFLSRLSTMPGIEEVTLTTNGLLLAKQAQALKAAGVKRLNVSIDSLQSGTYAQITRGGSLEKVLDGLNVAQAVGLKLKLNMVVMDGINDREVVPFAALSIDKPWSVRFIEYMPTIREKQWQKQLVSGADILRELRHNFTLQSISSDRYCGPAKPYRIEGAKGTVGIISPMSDHFCGSCNRIRVTSTGLAKSCLLAGGSHDLKPYLQQSTGDLRNALQQVIGDKPLQHKYRQEHGGSATFSMASIGG